MSSAPVPRHVGIIMDGNGRWARSRGRPASFGHRAGARVVKTVMGGCEELGIEVLSIYAFSTENWTRPRREVGFLMRLFHDTLDREFAEIQERNIRVIFSGRRDELDQRMRRRMEDAEAKTTRNTAGVLNVCLNYGGRAEVVDAVRAAVGEGKTGPELDESTIAAHLYQPWLPEPDLIIRSASGAWWRSSPWRAASRFGSSAACRPGWVSARRAGFSTRSARSSPMAPRCCAR